MLVFVYPSSAIRGLAEATLPLLRGAPVGGRNTRSVRGLARSVGVEMPITEQMYLLLYDDKPPRQVVVDLMARGLKRERTEGRKTHAEPLRVLQARGMQPARRWWESLLPSSLRRVEARHVAQGSLQELPRRGMSQASRRAGAMRGALRARLPGKERATRGGGSANRLRRTQ